MADFFYGVSRAQLTGTNPQGVTVATSTGSTDYEFHINTTNTPTTKEAILALRAIEQFLLTNGVGTHTGPGVDIPPTIRGS